MHRCMRVAVVGLGNIGTVHARTLLESPRVDSLVVTDLNPARAERLLSEFGADRVVAATSFESMLDMDVEAVVIATSADSHATLTAACVEAGRPVFCEKPIAGSGAEAAALIRRLGGSAPAVQVGFQRRHDAAFAAVKAAVDRGELGFVTTIRCVTLDPEPPSADYVASSGGIFRDCAIHDFDVIRWISGQEVAEVYAAASNRGASFFREAGDFDTAAVLLVLEQGALGVVSNSRYNGRGYDVRVEVHGSIDSTAAGIEMWTSPGSTDRGSRLDKALVRFGDAYRNELETFMDVVSAKCPSPCTPRDGLEALLIAEACDRSAREGRPVRVQEIRDEASVDA